MMGTCGKVRLPAWFPSLQAWMLALSWDYVCGQLIYPFIDHEMDCPEFGQRMLKSPYRIPWGHPLRAYLTVPPELEIAPSHIPNAGLGVISKTFIPKYTWLGEYEGEILPAKYKDEISWYTWTVYRADEIFLYVDAYHSETSNYMRFINTPNREIYENVDMLQCYGKVYYMTKKDIYPGQELLVFYGEGYLNQLNIDMDKYYEQDENNPAELTEGA